ncbi:MAG: hypothetical protein IKU25_03300 [Clostridia bacterium]|nr:hypothetical protein [Clostridia bacterium]
MFEDTNQTEIIVENTTDDEAGLLPYSLFESEEVKIPIKFNGEEMEISLNDAKTLAQKGLNYDHVLSQREAAHRVLDAIAESEGKTRGELIAEREGGEIGAIRWEALLREFPDLDADAIPQEVFIAVDEGKTPIEAYQRHLINELRVKLSEKAAEERNIGSLRSDGEGMQDAFLEGFFGKRY